MHCAFQQLLGAALCGTVPTGQSNFQEMLIILLPLFVLATFRKFYSYMILFSLINASKKHNFHAKTLLGVSNRHRHPAEHGTCKRSCNTAHFTGQYQSFHTGQVVFSLSTSFPFIRPTLCKAVLKDLTYILICCTLKSD